MCVYNDSVLFMKLLSFFKLRGPALGSRYKMSALSMSLKEGIMDFVVSEIHS